jgi:hypothetical protein
MGAPPGCAETNGQLNVLVVGVEPTVEEASVVRGGFRQGRTAHQACGCRDAENLLRHDRRLGGGSSVVELGRLPTSTTPADSRAVHGGRRIQAQVDSLDARGPRVCGEKVETGSEPAIVEGRIVVE